MNPAEAIHRITAVLAALPPEHEINLQYLGLSDNRLARSLTPDEMRAFVAMHGVPDDELKVRRGFCQNRATVSTSIEVLPGLDVHVSTTVSVDDPMSDKVVQQARQAMQPLVFVECEPESEVDTEIGNPSPQPV